jgi:signal transduction histidine kinase
MFSVWEIAQAANLDATALEQGSHWRISVSDNGQGFSPEYSVGIFEPFKRLHGPNVAGSGIGLATCKRVVERLGGRI